MTEYDFDVFVVGAGSGGVRAARLSASTGIKVAIAEEFRYGGTCVIRGCVPKKLMVNAADFRDLFEDAVGFGWKTDKALFSWKNFQLAKNREIDRLENIYYSNLQNTGVTVFGCRAQLIAPNEIALADGRVFSSKTVLIATGGEPFIPEFGGKEFAITSNEVFNLQELPERMIIVGGGYIASEFSSIFNGMGVDVTQIYRGEKILRGFDSDLRDHLTVSMIDRGVDLQCGLTVLNCKKSDKILSLTLSDGSTLESDCLLFATGRKPNTKNLGLEKIGVVLDSSGAIEVNRDQRSSIPSIYAIGDVTNRLNLTPVAIRDAIAFVETVVKNNPMSSDHDLVPTAVFTRPEIGTIGLTEDQARNDHSVKIYKTQFKPLANIIAGRNEVTIMKMVVDDVTRKVIGCHLIGPGAAEMIQMVAVAIKMGATKEDFDRTCAVHPTAAEELVTLN